MSKALEVIKKEYMNAQLSSKISKDVESKIQKRQREYWLLEQMKGIKRELGMESDGKDKLVEKFKEKAGKLAMPDPVRKVFDEELSKLAHLEPAASEFNVTRNYLDWLTQIPWGRRSAENFGIKHAREVLDEDHHGRDSCARDLGGIVERAARKPVRPAGDLLDRLVREPDQALVEEDRLDVPEPLELDLDVLLPGELRRPRFRVLELPPSAHCRIHRLVRSGKLCLLAHTPHLVRWSDI